MHVCELKMLEIYVENWSKTPHLPPHKIIASRLQHVSWLERWLLGLRHDVRPHSSYGGGLPSSPPASKDGNMHHTSTPNCLHMRVT
jgi:hypothetical protein